MSGDWQTCNFIVGHRGFSNEFSPVVFRMEIESVLNFVWGQRNAEMFYLRLVLSLNFERNF